MKQAILAAEDERFYQHGGIDFLGALRAAYANVFSGSKQGAGTITMQVARNFFLTREKTVTRKLNEALLAYKIERNLSKDEILELYLNQIYLGQRAYGFAAAAHIYFGKPLAELSLAETAMLAGLPKAPSTFNPVANPKRAKLRQQYVLRRMRELNFITDAQLQDALRVGLHVKRDLRDPNTHADYVAEMARQVVFDAYGEEAYSKGFRVITTVRKADQESAYRAVRRGVLDYDRRHGYRGPEAFVTLPEDQAALEDALESAFQEASDSDDLLAAVVLEAGPKLVKAVRPDGEMIEIAGEGLKFAQKALADKAPANLRLRRGAVIRVSRDDKGGWQITQLPQVESAFISVDPQSGAIISLIGGFDFFRNKYNHVTQAQRQPGSSFKPFIYSAALEKGFTPATVVNDAPLFFDAATTGSEPWEPKNYDGKFEGPMLLRTALMKSKNMVSIRILQAIGVHYAQDYVTRFGFDAKQHPAYLTMALGAGSATPLQMAAAYSIFANGGYRVTPQLIQRIESDKGETVSAPTFVRAGEGAERAIDARNAFVMTTLMRDVVRAGTAAKAMSLGRQDLAGKTGTTNDHIDAWFCGFNSGLVGIAWIGYDQPRNMGNGETGGQTALPIWMYYMAKALKGVEEQPLEIPEGIVMARINSGSGLRVTDNSPGVLDYFYSEYLPPLASETPAPATPNGRDGQEVRNQLF
jgi:penicillin-binding protein 1A